MFSLLSCILSTSLSTSQQQMHSALVGIIWQRPHLHLHGVKKQHYLIQYYSIPLHSLLNNKLPFKVRILVESNQSVLCSFWSCVDFYICWHLCFHFPRADTGMAQYHLGFRHPFLGLKRCSWMLKVYKGGLNPPNCCWNRVFCHTSAIKSVISLSTGSY